PTAAASRETRSTLLPEAGFRPSYFRAWAFRSSRVTNSRAEAWLASRSTGAARPCSSADFQRVTQTHHLSPGFNPGKPHSGIGVTRSLPSSTEKSRNSRVTFTQTVCKPMSSGAVRQKPSRKNPVIGSRQQHFSSVPRTFVGMTNRNRVLQLKRWLRLRSAGGLARPRATEAWRISPAAETFVHRSSHADRRDFSARCCYRSLPNRERRAASLRPQRGFFPST